MLKILQNHNYIPIQLAIRILLLMALTGCGSPAPQSASPTLPPVPTWTASPIPPTPTTVTPTSRATPLPVVSESRAINPQNAAEVIQVARLGQGMINGAPFYSADGQLLVIPTTIGVDLYAAATLEKLGSIPALSDGDVTLVPTYPRLVALSQDQRLLAVNLNTPVYSPDGDIQEDSIGKAAIFLWDVADGTLVRKIPLSSENSLADLAFSLDGQTLAAGFEAGSVQFWRLTDGEELYSVAGSQLEFSSDGSLLATMPSGYGGDNHIYMYSTASGDLLRQWEGTRAIFSPNGFLAVESDGAVRVIDVEKGIVLQAFNGKSAAFSADGQRLALLDQGQIKLYSVADGNLLQTMEGEFEAVLNLQFAPDGQTLAIVGEAPMCPNCLTAPAAALWQISDGMHISLEIQDPLGLTYAPHQGYLVVWAIAGIHILNPANASAVALFDEYATSVDGIAFSPDGQTAAANSGQPHLTARAWQVVDSRLVKVLEDPNNPGYGDSKVLFSPDGQILSAQGSFWRVADGERLVDLEKVLAGEAPPYVPASIAFSPDGSTLAIGYLEGYLQLWDFKQEKLIRRLEGYSGEVVSLAFSPDGKTLAAVFSHPDYIVQFLKVPEGERLLTIKGAEWTYVFTEAVFSPDGGTLATVAKNEDVMEPGIAELWSASDGQRLSQLDVLGVLDLAFSPDGKIIATGSYDHMVRLWQTEDGELLQTLRGHGAYVTDLTFSPSGKLLASSSHDGTVILWGIRSAP